MLMIVKGGAAYGESYDPSNFGSGGGNASPSVLGGAGGGFVRIVTNKITMYGSTISANGAPGYNSLSTPNATADDVNSGGGGSGGSISIHTKSFFVSNTAIYPSTWALPMSYISAMGGRSGLVTEFGGVVGGGGSGGRVFLASNSTIIQGNDAVTYLLSVSVDGGYCPCPGRTYGLGSVLAQCTPGIHFHFELFYSFNSFGV